jgi:hypothetical protein
MLAPADWTVRLREPFVVLDPLHRGFDKLRRVAPILHWSLRTTRQPVIISVQRI